MFKNNIEKFLKNVFDNLSNFKYLYKNDNKIINNCEDRKLRLPCEFPQQLDKVKNNSTNVNSTYFYYYLNEIINFKLFIKLLIEYSIN